jgi:diaminohydroxyphosphoribosylaminopyrimidine deaminase/5-amino-6-(5-phosphoribosylamino)uracil reductase
LFIDDAYAYLYSLSLLGLGVSTPNPNVSAAIYGRDGNLIADGFHNRKISSDHAEIVALKKAGGLAKGATMVVSLEPCNHFGTTPPCTQAIIDAGIAKVIFAVPDPNPIASGGMRALEAAGVLVEHHHSDLLTFAQRAWLHKVQTGLPLLIWKVAITLDGKVAASDGSSQWITNSESREDVQLLRSQSDALLVGTNTVLTDNPHLLPRGYENRPLRVIFGERELPPTLSIFDDEARTIWIKSKSIPELLDAIKSENLNQALIEAGPTLGTALFKSGIVDELIIYMAPKLLGSGKPFLHDLGIGTLDDHIELELLSHGLMGSDVKLHYRVKEH